MVKSETVVMAFGAFDGIHTGHIYYLLRAKEQGNYLIVAIARDKSKWKFPERYKLPEKERKKLVERLKIADKVILGSKTRAMEKIEKIKPDVIAISEYTPVSSKVLQSELRNMGLKTKVVDIRKFRDNIYKHMYVKTKRTREELMGLPPKEK